MYKYSLRVVNTDLLNWTPLIGVVSFISFLVGNCAYQMIWSHSAAFVEGVERQGLNSNEFHIVSQTIYFVVLCLAFFSLTVVGNSTVKKTQFIFAQWKLLGASRKDVRNCLLLIILYISFLGSFFGRGCFFTV